MVLKFFGVLSFFSDRILEGMVCIIVLVLWFCRNVFMWKCVSFGILKEKLIFLFFL